jgi:hypothetical protein
MACRPDLELLEVRRPRCFGIHTLLSFERPSSGRFFLSVGFARVHLENSIVAKASVLYDQETKGTRWMPWRQEPMKDVGGCDKPGEGADHPLIPGFPNGETYAW